MPDDNRWLMYECSDCYPTAVGSEYEKPALLILPSYIDRPDYCPRCGSYLSLDDGTEVRVERVPYSERTHGRRRSPNA